MMQVFLLLEILSKKFFFNFFLLKINRKDHWNLYLNDFQTKKIKNSKVILEIMMHDLSRSSMKHFFKKEGKTNIDVTKESGIQELIPGLKIDSHLFEPCGYSMNGMLENYYSTIHITPEDGFSYVSFETNISADLLDKIYKKDKKEKKNNYSKLIENVINLFGPNRFTISFITSNKSEKLDGKNLNFKKKFKFVQNKSTVNSFYLTSINSI
jgi:S-adenosylmethionine decarboxylase